MINFRDIFFSIVEDVQIKWGSEFLTEPYRMADHPINIFNILSEKSKSDEFKFQKYPLICLYMDFDEVSENGLNTVSDMTFVIMTETSGTIDMDNRFETNFDPILTPIYDLFINAIKDSPYVASSDRYSHTTRKRPYYGTEDTWGNSANIGNDKLDGIVITGLSLELTGCAPPFRDLYNLTFGDMNLVSNDQYAQRVIGSDGVVESTGCLPSELAEFNLYYES